MSKIGRGLTFLSYLYLIRVPLLVWITLVTLWAGSFTGSGSEPILRGIFDIAAKDSPFATVLVRFGLVTVAALLAGTSIGVSARLVVCNAHVRFGVTPVSLSAGLELLFRLIPLLAFLAVVMTAATRVEVSWTGKVAGIAVGCVIWYGLTISAKDLGRFYLPIVHWAQDKGLILQDEPGYFELDANEIQGREIQARHLFASFELSSALATYLAYCAISALDLFFLNGKFLVPSLSLILLLLTLVCWALSGISFFLDRYLVPVLAPIVLLVMLSSFFRQGDHFYEGLPLQPRTPVAPSAADILPPGGQVTDHDTPIVLVATTGGGIQAASWTARILSRLDRDVSISRPGEPANFSSHVRLVSSVSGGSVGTMFFLASYKNGKASDDGLVSSAEGSSLDDVSWGLAYPDLAFGFMPWLKGIGVSQGDFHAADGGLIYFDRGRMLESSWLNRISKEEQNATLDQWRADAEQRTRPAVIFNSTLVETGERYLLATTSFIPPSTAAAKQDEFAGRREFSKLYKQSDLRIRTAVRLSATFPYVTPAARLLRNDPVLDSKRLEEGRFFRPEPHAVDGGYYDNYGMVSLLDWLDNRLQTTTLRPKILIIEIRASQISPQGRPRSSSYGAVFQLTHPLLTLAHVRGTGQLSHNGLDESLVNRLYGNVCEATFEFTNTDDRGCPRAEPLNWHLTPSDIRALESAENGGGVAASVARVQAYLNGGPCQ